MYKYKAHEKYVCLLNSGDLIPVGVFTKEFETVLPAREDWDNYYEAHEKANKDLREIAFQKMEEICNKRKEDFAFLIESDLLELYAEDFIKYMNLTSYNKPDDIWTVAINLWIYKNDEEDDSEDYVNDFKEVNDLLEKNPNSKLLQKIKDCLDVQIEYIKESSF